MSDDGPRPGAHAIDFRPRVHDIARMPPATPTLDDESPLNCLNCGYDMRGLPLPRPCPECGCESDPRQYAADVVTWYTSSRGFWMSSPPRFFMRYMDDVRCRYFASRRFRRAFLLPWVLLLVTLFAVSCIEVTHTYMRWSPDTTQPTVRRDLDYRSFRRRALGPTGASDDLDVRPNMQRMRTFVRLVAPRFDAAVSRYAAFFTILGASAIATAWLALALGIAVSNARSNAHVSYEGVHVATTCLAGPAVVTFGIAALNIALRVLTDWRCIPVVENRALPCASIIVLAAVIVWAGRNILVAVGACRPRCYGAISPAALLASLGWAVSILALLAWVALPEFSR